MEMHGLYTCSSTNELLSPLSLSFSLSLSLSLSSSLSLSLSSSPSPPPPHLLHTEDSLKEEYGRVGQTVIHAPVDPGHRHRVEGVRQSWRRCKHS